MGIACETDALTRAGFERRRAFAGFTMIEVPERRDFWYGNALVLDREPTPGEQRVWLARHAELFAGHDVRRGVLVWEVTGERIAAPDVIADDGLSLDRSTVFVRSEPFADVPEPSTMREFADAADWDAAARISCDEFARDGGRADFERWRFAKMREAAGVGLLRMWGAWEAGALVAFAGTYARAGGARFATPVTLPACRGRGYFRALSALAVNTTLRSFPNASVVICAGADDAASEVYRRLGFTALGEQFGLVARMVR